MAFNKYTQITPAKYDARSLQETLYLPTLKRKQHDQMSQNLAETDAALNQYDSLDFQSELVNQEKDKLREELDKQASQLASQGIKSGSKSQFLDLASKFSEATSVNGKIGKAKQIKDNYLKNRQRITENMVKSGYSPEDAQAFLDKQFEEYKQKWDGENLNEIELYDAPKYMNIQEEFMKLKPAMGKDIETKLAKSGYKIAERDGHFVYTTKSGNIQTETNDDQLDYALAILNNEFLADGSKGKKSLDVQGITKEAAAGKINNLMGLASTNIVRDNTKVSHRFAQNTLSRGRSGSGSGATESNLLLGGSKVKDTPTSFGFESIKDLRSKTVVEDPSDKEQVIQARKNQKILDAVRKKAESMPGFKNITKKITETKENINNQVNEEHKKVIDRIGARNISASRFSQEEIDYLDSYFESKGISYKEGMEPIRESANLVLEEESQLRGYNQELEEIYNSAMNEQVITTTEYSILDKSKDRKERLASVGPIMADNENSEVTGISVLKSNDDVENLSVEENQKLIEVLRKNFNDNNFKDSEIVNTSLVKNNVSQGIKIAIQMGEEDVADGVYEDADLEPGETLSIMVSPKDLENGEVPTYLAQYLNQNYGTKGVKEFQRHILDNKYPATTDIDQLGMNGINSRDLFFAGENNEQIDFLGESKKVNNNNLEFETPYIIKNNTNPNGTSATEKRPMTLNDYVNKVKNSDFKTTNSDFIVFVESLYNDLVKSGKYTPNKNGKTFKENYIDVTNGIEEIEETQFNDLLEEIGDENLIFSDSENKSRMIKLAQKYKNI